MASAMKGATRVRKYVDTRLTVGNGSDEQIVKPPSGKSNYRAMLMIDPKDHERFRA
jgi:hypothetical protein